MPLKELDSVPELRDDPSLKDFNDLPTLAKSYKETKAFVGTSIRPPGPDATPEARKEFYDKLQKHAPDLVPLKPGDAEAEKLVWNKLGRPAKREDYKFPVPEGVDVNLDVLREAAEVSGLTQVQFEKLADKAVKGAQAQGLALAKEREALKAEWGPGYEVKLKNAAAVAQRMGQSEAMVGAIMAGKLPSAALKTWDSIATAIGSEGKGPAGQHNANEGTATRAELELQFKEVQSNPAYFNTRHPEHERLVRRGKELMAKLHPG